MATDDLGNMTDDALATWVRTTIEHEREESLELDYKQDFDGAVAEPAVRREFAKDVSAFANTRGGPSSSAFPSGRSARLFFPHPSPIAEYHWSQTSTRAS